MSMEPKTNAKQSENPQSGAGGPGLFTRLQSNLVDSVRESVDWDKWKCCGKKRFHQQAFQPGKRRSIVRSDYMTRPQSAGTHPQLLFRPMFSNPNNSGSIELERQPSVASSISSKLEASYPYKRQRLDHSFSSFRSNASIQSRRRDVVEGLQQFENISRMINDKKSDKQSQFSIIPTPSHTLDNRSQDDISQLDDFIRSKEAEIEQLKRLKEQHLMQQEVSQVRIEQSPSLQQEEQSISKAYKFDFVRGPSYRKNESRRISGMQRQFNESGLFERPFERTQIFNTSNSSINAAISQLNNSFESSRTIHTHHNEFSIPYQLPRRDNLNTHEKNSVQSILEEPLPLKTHMRVQSQTLQRENGKNGSTNSRPQLNQISMPQDIELKALQLPQLKQSHIKYINKEFLNIAASSDELQESICRDSDLQKKDIRHLCISQKQVEDKIVRCYQSLLKNQCKKDIQIYGTEELELNSDEWQAFAKNTCQQYILKQHSILFGCIIPASSDNDPSEDFDFAIYDLSNKGLSITYFGIDCQNNFKVDFYTSRIKELHKNLTACQSLKQNGNDKKNKTDNDIKEDWIVPQENSDACIDQAILYAYYLRSLCLQRDNHQNSQERIQELTCESQYEEYFRYSMAIEIIKGQML